MEHTVQDVQSVVVSPERLFKEQIEVERALERKFANIDMSSAVARHPNLTVGMRWMLVEWLYQTVEYYGNPRQTFWLAATLLDTFLVTVTHELVVDKLQLLGSIFYWIAAKNEHGYDSPSIEDIVHLLGDMSIKAQNETKKELLDGECMVLNALSFGVIYPSPASLLDHFFLYLNRKTESAGSNYELCCYLLDVTALDVRFNAFSASERAGGALYTARVLTGHKHPWDSMEQVVQVPYSRILSCSMSLLNCILREESGSKSFMFRKYNRAEHHRVSAIAMKRAKVVIAHRSNQKRPLEENDSISIPRSQRSRGNDEISTENGRVHFTQGSEMMVTEKLTV